MQRWTAIGFALLFLLACAGVVVAKMGSRSSASASAGGADAGADAAALDAGLDAGASGGAEEATDGGDAPPDGPPPDAGVGRKLLSGEEAPALAAEAPKSVIFGVILIQYKGAQGVTPNTRSKEAALELAKQLAAEAKQDFKATVGKGDKGSMENAGRIPRGILEPAPEFVLFSLEKGGVSDPVDTPRGYWIVQRVE